jgi:hypothetical protein
VEVVRSLYRVMAGRDLEGDAKVTDPKLEWISERRAGVGPIRGRENEIRFFLDLR